ncbi:hypothetical protein AB0J06_24655, partial [Micromonospora sp. NPDC049679]
MRHALADRDRAGGPGPDPSHAVVTDATARLSAPGLVVITGGPGCGRSTLLRRLGAAFHGPVFTGGALATLRGMPAFALTTALRVRLPTEDPALLAEAVRARVRDGLLLLDDLQWADGTLTAYRRNCGQHRRRTPPA